VKIFVSADGRRGFVLRVAAFVLFFLVLLLVSRQALPLFANPEYARALIGSYGPLAPLVFIGLQIAQVVIAPIPGQAMGVVSGYLFGAALGTLYSVTRSPGSTASPTDVARRGCFSPSWFLGCPTTPSASSPD
jgi:uncharacterized membrane protein YdjX (TVP38/TMEM64 family)